MVTVRIVGQGFDLNADGELGAWLDVLANIDAGTDAEVCLTGGPFAGQTMWVSQIDRLELVVQR